MSAITQPADRLDFKSILPIIVIVFVDLLGLSIIIPLLPLYAARFSATPLVIGILQATYPLMQFLGAPILGRLSDRYGRRPVLVVSQLGTLAGFILLGFANTLFLLFLSRIIDGLSGMPAGEVLWWCVAVSLVVIVTRLIWSQSVVFVIRALDRRESQRMRRSTWQSRMIISWCGMRGSVSRTTRKSQ